MSPNPVRTQSYCYTSTPDHVRSFVGRFIYIYTGKAELTLDEQQLSVTRIDGFALSIPLKAISSIEKGHYSRWAKPLGLDYIAICYGDSDSQRTVLLTPTRSWSTPTWETNKIVEEWLDLLHATCGLTNGR